MACFKSDCSCCRTAFAAGVVVGLSVGFSAGYQAGYKRGYVNGYSDAVLGIEPPATYKPLIEARVKQFLNPCHGVSLAPGTRMNPYTLEVLEY